MKTQYPLITHHKIPALTSLIRVFNLTCLLMNPTKSSSISANYDRISGVPN